VNPGSSRKVSLSKCPTPLPPVVVMSHAGACSVGASKAEGCGWSWVAELVEATMISCG